MSGALAALLAFAELPPFIESRIEIGSDRFEYQLADVDLDVRVDLIVTACTNGERTLRLWRQRPDASFPSAPDWTLAVPADVISWSLLDLRAEPGREVLLMTRGGVHSVSTTRVGLKDNLRRELAAPLFPDLPDPTRLPCWRLTRDVDGDGKEELLLIADDALRIFAPAADPAATPALVEVGRLPASERPLRARTRGTFSFGGGGMRGEGPLRGATWFAGARTSQPAGFDPKLLERRRTLELPRLMDFGGDGSLERIETSGSGWNVTPLTLAGGSSAGVVHVELPRAARDADSTEWLDVDGDGRNELVAYQTGGDDKVAMLFPATADPATPLAARIAETPTARIKLAGMGVQFWLTDVDHDGRLDLTARVVDVPTGLSTLATVRLDTAFHVFRGQPGASWSRVPDFSWERSFRPEQLTRVQESLLINLGGDFDGDGCNDLVTTQLDGRVEIRRVSKGEQLALETKPVVSFAPPAPVDRLETWDLSMDGIADLMLRHEQALTFFVSRGQAKESGK